MACKILRGLYTDEGRSLGFNSHWLATPKRNDDDYTSLSSVVYGNRLGRAVSESNKSQLTVCLSLDHDSDVQE